MRKLKKAVSLVLLGFLEVVFLSLILANTLPRRSADIDSFARYEKAPTAENREIWLKERQKTENEVDVRRYVGGCLALGNLFLIVYIARKQIVPLVANGAAIPASGPLDSR
jgi:hypothetical protein